MTWELIVLFVMSAVTFFVYGLDKLLAITQRWRVPEALLFVLAGFDGAFGALCAMLLFRHKTQHHSFLVTIPVLLGFWLIIHVLLRIFVIGV